MKKRFLSLLALLALLAALPVSANAEAPLLVDGADLLTDTEEIMVQEVLRSTGDKLNMDVVVVTTDSLDGKSARAYADDYYDYNDYAADGVLLLVSMTEREWWISTSGNAIQAISNSEIDRLGELFVDKLSTGDYQQAFAAFAYGVERYAETSENESAGGSPVTAVLICLAIGVAVAFIVVLILKRQLKSVRSRSEADSYVVKGSFQLSGSRDLFLFRNVTRVEKAQSSSHHGSSGRSHGGGGGRF